MRKYTVLIYVIAFILVASLLVWYLNNTIIPIKLKKILIESIEKQTQLSVKIGDLKFHIFKGFELSNITISRGSQSEDTILKADKAWFRPIIIPSLHKIHVVIPILGVGGASIKLEKNENGNWNFLKPVLSKTDDPEKQNKRVSLAVLKVSLTDGTVLFNDNSKMPQISETLNNVNANFGLSLPNSLSLSLNAQIYTSPINIKGKILNPFKEPKVNLKVTATGFDIKNIKALSGMGLQGGEGNIKADILLEPDGTSIIKAEADIKSLEFKKQKLNLTGDFNIDAYLQGNIKALDSFSYKGAIKFKKTQALFNNVFLPVSEASGEALFIDKAITIKDFSGNIANSLVSLSGKLDYSTLTPDISINISANAIDLKKLIQNLPQEVKLKLKQIDLEGTADLNISVVNKKDSTQALSYKGDIKIYQTGLICPWIEGKLEDINCVIIFEKDAITWDDLSCKYKNVSYTSSGLVTELMNPSISASLKSKDLKFKGAIKLEGDTLTLQKLDATYKKHSFKASGYLKNFEQPVANYIIDTCDGTINITTKANLETKEKPYLINIDVKNINLEKFITAANLKKAKAKKVKGILALQMTLNGYLQNKDSLKGTGWVQVSEGYLGEFPVVSDLLNAVLGIPPEYLRLTDAFGNFTIQNRRIYTTDFRILSQKAALLWEGSVGFNKTLDFKITGRFAEDISTKTSSLGKIASAILHKAGTYIVDVRLGGTIDNPAYKIMPFSVDKIFSEETVDKIKDIFGDIFE